MRQTALAIQKAILPSFAIYLRYCGSLLLVFNPTGDRAEPAVMLPARGSARDKVHRGTRKHGIRLEHLRKREVQMPVDPAVGN